MVHSLMEGHICKQVYACTYAIRSGPGTVLGRNDSVRVGFRPPMTDRRTLMTYPARCPVLVTAILLLSLGACGPQPGLRRAARSNRVGADSVAKTSWLSASAPLVTGPTVVAFWLHGVDTLVEADRAAAWEDFRNNAAAVASFFDEHGVTVLATAVDTIFVRLVKGPRRIIMMSGLEYPYGYVLVEPGFTERILAGVYSQEELVDEARDYFELPEDTASGRIASGAPGRVVRHGRRGLRSSFARWPGSRGRAR